MTSGFLIQCCSSPELWVYDSRGVSGSTHPTCAHGSIARHGHVADEAFHVGVGKVAKFGALWQQLVRNLEVPVLHGHCLDEPTGVLQSYGKK